ncbi:MAG: protein kinase, partial [Acidobacteriota bacterium]
MASEHARRRFVAERHAMGRLSHPNVGKILDGGATEQGTPFLVMEHIEGQPFTEYCDAHALELDARLRLFVEVCRGVEHAHSRFVLHRDIKPNNVLVTEVDGRPV